MADPMPGIGGELVERFIEERRIKDPPTASEYRSAVRRLEKLAALLPERPPGSRTARLWLREACAVPVERWVRRTQKLSGYLDWLVHCGLLTRNPFAALRDECGVSTTADLVRGLAAVDPEAHFRKVRRPTPFQSHLGRLLQDHVARMQALGYRYDPQRFAAFDRFLQGRPGAASEDFAALVREYAAQALSPAERVKRLSVGRVVAKVLERSGVAVARIQRPRVLVQEANRTRRRPHIYTPQEVQHCLETARALERARAPLRPHTLHMMLALAYCAGLRFGELLRLQLGDLSLETGELEIRESKFFKTRRIPLNRTVIDELRCYLLRRRELAAPQAAASPLFWNEVSGGGYSRTCAWRWLRVVLDRRAGVEGHGGCRVHELRHSFATQRLTDWYVQGVDVQAKLPLLAAYMGHKNIRSTLLYLTMTPQLLEQASRRFHPLAVRALGIARTGQP